MAKRFSDTNVWEEDWFILLPPIYKLLWQWITSKCDHAGIWKPNLEAFRKFNGEVDLEKAMEFYNDYSKDRLVKLPNGKYFLPGFFVFQYGEKMNLKNKVHNSIYEAYMQNDINLDSVKGLKELIEKDFRPQDDLNLTSSRPHQGVKDKDKEKDKDNINKGVLENCETEPELMKDFKIEDCTMDKSSSGYKVADTSIRVYHGFVKSFPNNRDLPLMKKIDWIPPIRKLLEKKDYPPERVIEVAKWAVKDPFWKTVVLDTISLEKNFEKLKAKYHARQTEA